MKKRVILITGTPCVGKTTVAKELAVRMQALYINLTDLAKTHNLILGLDETRNTNIVDEKRMRHKISELLEETDDATAIIDGHYAAAVVPKSLVTQVFVLRRNPVELRVFMEKCGFTGAKLWENLASEILDVCLVEALREIGVERVCELDITDKKLEIVVGEVLSVMNERKPCRVGCVDWLGMLEAEGVLDDYLKV
jgi:adenylate kinase